MGEDKGDLLHKRPQKPYTETISSTQLERRLDCLLQDVQLNNKVHHFALKAHLLGKSPCLKLRWEPWKMNPCIIE